MLARAALVWAALASPVLAGNLIWPVDCALGDDCFIQQYVDRDPGPGALDYTCGSLSYQGHRGTDIRLIDERAMAAGVNVLSASAGVVIGIRDGVPDHAQGRPGAPGVKGRECGNGVLIQRADGWRFQYCHLRKGSVRVRKGEPVAPGALLGQIGLSGRTQFPHLHLTVRDQARRVIDPFDRREQNESCTLKDTRSLWRDLGPGSYQPGGALAAGFGDAVPTYSAVTSGQARASEPGRDADALVFWAHFFGLRRGDRIALDLTGPDGERLASQVHTMDRHRATEMRAIGRKARRIWPIGTYIGRAVLLRGNTEIDRIEAHLSLD